MCNSEPGKETQSDKPTAMTQSSSPKNIGETAVPSTSKEMVCNENKQEGLKVPKVGIMFNAFTKRGAKTSSGEDSDYEPSGGEEDKEEHLQDNTSESAVFKHKYLTKGSWICAQSSSQSRENYNKYITDKLEALAQTYENTNDKWRALGYQKGIIALKRHPKEIKTWEEAKNLPGVGQRLADKIWEIIESGELRKLNELSGQEEVKAINLFANVWGAGTVTARSWVQLGFRTLEDLRTKANLTYQQRIGLRYYEDILDRMPREEAAEIEATVCEAVRAIDPSLVAMACGSFRRGKVTCGDVDVLVTHPDGKSHKGVFQTLLKNLHATASMITFAFISPSLLPSVRQSPSYTVFVF
ncbi:DNA polymerase lambda [Lamellibrachia satsuma]|nr:DNA polymerase lambda [Lamellibrachia satsuma]